MRTLFLFITCLVSISVLPDADHKVLCGQFYRWNELTNEVLMEKGNDYMRLQEKYDSAMICFSILSNRYYENKLEGEDMAYGVRAMVKIAALLIHHYGDFEKAQSYLLMAEDIARKNHLEKCMPYLLNIKATLIQKHAVCFQLEDADSIVLSANKEAYLSSLEMKQWNALVGNIIDMAYYAVANDIVPSVRKEMDVFLKLSIPDTAEHIGFARNMCEAIICFEQHDYEKCFRLLEALSQSDDHQEKRKATLLQGWLHFRLDEDEEGLQAFDKVERLTKDTNCGESCLDVYHFKSLYYHDKHNKALADKYRLLYLEERDSIENSSKMNKVGETEFLFQLYQANDEIREQAYKRQMQERMMWMAIGFSILLAALLVLLLRKYMQIRQKNEQLYRRNAELVKTEVDNQQQEKPKYAKRSLGKDAKTELMSKIQSVMESSDEIFSVDFSQGRLAEICESDQNHVSQVINELCNCNYNALLNEYRIHEARRRISDQVTYGNYTIEAIAESVGFKSRSHFVRLFKEQTGLTPSTYIKMARKQL